MMTSLQSMFKRVVNTLAAEDVAHLLIGGMAVNYYGFTRATLDVDFMVAVNDATRARQALIRAGFMNAEERDHVIFLYWPDQLVRVDLLKVEADTLNRLWQGAESISLHDVMVRVPALEDLIAMKLFALKHGGARRMGKDMIDIVQLAFLHKLDIEHQLRPLTLRFADETLFDQIKQQVLDWRKDETASDQPA